IPYTHLTENERYVISHLRIAGFSLREIARRIKRHHTTVSRKLERNGPEHDCTVYWYDWTHSRVLKRRHKARHHRLVTYIINKPGLRKSLQRNSRLTIQTMIKCA
ncbi:MAG: helix-turn-helix domain-containing protein, partial [Thermodesulfobacteriota bacterium]|nr:helix-turn-helix domain-containing protein [Thermodesulfobacteriota bacterium]